MQYISYDCKQYLKDLDTEKLKNLNKDIILTLKEFVSDLKLIDQKLTIRIPVKYMSFSFRLCFLNQVIDFLEKTSLDENYFHLLDKFIKIKKREIIKYVDFENKKYVEDKLNIFVKIVKNKINKVIFKKYNNQHLNNKAKITLQIDHLQFYHLTVLSNSVTKIIYKETSLLKEEVCKDFGIDIVEYTGVKDKENLSLETIIKDKSDFEFIELSMNCNKTFNLNNKTNYIDLRVLFNNKNFHPNLSFITKYIYKNISIGNTLYLIYPLFLNTNSDLLESKQHGYFKLFYKFPKYHIKLIKQLTSLATDYKLNIIIPNVMNYNEYLQWYVMINSIFDKNHISRVNVGLMIDDFGYLDDIEEHEHVDVVILDYDELSYNITNDDGVMDYLTFKEELMEEFREIHRYFRYKKIDHPILSKELKNKHILEKLLMMGFSKSIYSYTYFKEINTMHSNYMSRRGKYVGLNKGRSR